MGALYCTYVDRVEHKERDTYIHRYVYINVKICPLVFGGYNAITIKLLNAAINRIDGFRHDAWHATQNGAKTVKCMFLFRLVVLGYSISSATSSKPFLIIETVLLFF